MEKIINAKRAPITLLLVNLIMAIIYFSWWLFPNRAGNVFLYGLLFLGEIYHLLMAFSFWLTIWPASKDPKKEVTAPPGYQPSVDIFITVAGEPVEVVGETARAAKRLNYSNHRVYLLNDGFVAKKENWQEIEELAKLLQINCITRKNPGGAKAGNINNALRQTEGEIVVIFDADMVPEPSFLEKTILYFSNPKVGFVQTPQFYKNAELNDVTSGAWGQQEFFFGPIMQGKEKDNAAFICGTNVAIRRIALEEVGGMVEDNIAEDFLTSLKIHQKKWTSFYVPDVLATGLAPEDLMSYFKQQLRWARGSLEVLFGANPLFKGGLSLRQKIQYLSSALFYFNGLIVLIDIAMPLLFLFFSLQPVTSSTTSFAAFFLPFIFLTLYTIYLSSNGSMTFKAIAFTHSSWYLQLLALRSVITREKMSFSVTPKKAQEGNFLNLAYPHIIYLLLTIAGITVGIMREGLSPSVSTNIAWAILNVVLFFPFIKASYSWENLFVPKVKTQKGINETTVTNTISRR